MAIWADAEVRLSWLKKMPSPTCLFFLIDKTAIKWLFGAFVKRNVHL